MMEIRTLTQDEVKKLGLYPHETYALIFKDLSRVFLSTDSLKAIDETLNRMTEKHPIFNELEVVKQP